MRAHIRASTAPLIDPKDDPNGYRPTGGLPRASTEPPPHAGRARRGPAATVMRPIVWPAGVDPAPVVPPLPAGAVALVPGVTARRTA